MSLARTRVERRVERIGMCGREACAGAVGNVTKED